MKNILLFLTLTVFYQILFAQDMSSNYNITIWNKAIDGSYKKSELKTIGFLPVYDNTKTEYIIRGVKVVYQSDLNIQVLSQDGNNIKLLLEFKNNFKQYKIETVVIDKEIKDLNDFNIQIVKNN